MPEDHATAERLTRFGDALTEAHQGWAPPPERLERRASQVRRRRMLRTIGVGGLAIVAAAGGLVMSRGTGKGGELVRVASGDAGYSAENGRVVIAAGTVDGLRWTATVEGTPPRVTAAMAADRRPGGGSSVSNLDAWRALEQGRLSWQVSVARDRIWLMGEVPQAARVVRLETTDGTTEVRPVGTWTDRPVTYFATVLPEGEAVRAASALDAEGHVLVQADIPDYPRGRTLDPHGAEVSIGFGVKAIAGFPFAATAPAVVNGSAGQELRALRQAGPFSVRLPGVMPFGYELARVVASPGAQGTYSLDLYYGTADGQTLHIWQSNRSDLAGKDPARDGTPTDVHGRSWRTGSLEGGGHWLASRFVDGVTVEVDHTGDIDIAKIVAASLYRDNYPPGSG